MRGLVLALLFLPGMGFSQNPEKRSGYEFMSRPTQAMQDDDFANPGMLSVQDGEALFKQKMGAAGKACSECHAGGGMKGVSARYPAFDPKRNRPINIEQRINACRVDSQKAEALQYESKGLLALAAYVGHQSRGMPVGVSLDEQSKPFLERGRKIFFERQGQINLACTQCHDQNAGKKLAGSVIPQAHPTGYPQYRLEWQAVGSLHRRLRNCLVGMRAEPYELGAPDLVDLELYLMSRARGMTIETPAVRP